MKSIVMFGLLILVSGFGCQEKTTPPDSSAQKPAVEKTRPLPRPKELSPRTGQDKDLFQVPLGDSPTSGPSGAAVTLVLFGDLTDPESGRMFATLKGLHTEYPDSVRWVFKHYPSISRDSVAMQAAQTAIAAAELGRFEQFATLVFGPGDHLTPDGLVIAGRETGVDEKRIRAAWTSEPIKLRLLADRRLAARLAVRKTPALFVNGRRVDPGVDLASRISEERKRAAELVDRGIAPDQLYRTMTSTGRKSAWMMIQRPTRPTAMEKPVDQPQAERVDHQTVQVAGGEGLSLGKVSAPVRLVMFAELSCSFCGQMFGRLQALWSKYPEAIRVDVRLLPDRKARKRFVDAAILLHALRSKPAAWKLAPKLYAQSEANREEMLGWAGDLGLEVAVARRALADPKSTLDDLQKNRQAADAAGVRRSPYLFVNGRPIPGATSLTTLERMVTEELRQARGP